MSQRGPVGGAKVLVMKINLWNWSFEHYGLHYTALMPLLLTLVFSGPGGGQSLFSFVLITVHKTIRAM